MKIFYDNQVFIIQKIGGVSRYFCELIKHSTGLFNYSIGGIFSENIYAHEIGFHKSYPVKEDFEGKWDLQKQINVEDITTKLKDCYDVYHPTYYNPMFIDKVDKPIVLTVYDMIHEFFPQDLGILNKKTFIEKSTRIIAISECTKNDLLRFYPHINPDKVSVIYLGTSWNTSIDLQSVSHFNMLPASHSSPYILFTGNREKYKNFTNFILGVAPLLLKYNLYLKCTGRSFTNAENDLLKQQKIFDRTSIQLVNDCELKELYTNALCFVFPSLYEGFGIPILEAFACGCPLVLSNTSCFPEIAADAGVYFDPNSIEDMRVKIDKVICSETLRKDLVSKGFERLKKFSWQKCTEQTAKVYESARYNKI
ncbi:MAG: glycosyltransferase family 4 protein [Chitinispirillales bacterium]|jgi:glycosyltransferase involved in cell wall biosynthesis|nr:glycosyltransferase family 4 protein [Chitinispirillales bacterium]